mmetsp:Transcript_80908/g.203548  ORF Transcript_80908/g.203548 Transcript_80908/m.203548 type:complete len:258 (-) Transcript_80908:229-1002(-)
MCTPSSRPIAMPATPPPSSALSRSPARGFRTRCASSRTRSTRKEVLEILLTAERGVSERSRCCSARLPGLTRTRLLLGRPRVARRSHAATVPLATLGTKEEAPKESGQLRGQSMRRVENTEEPRAAAATARSLLHLGVARPLTPCNTLPLRLLVLQVAALGEVRATMMVGATFGTALTVLPAGVNTGQDWTHCQSRRRRDHRAVMDGKGKKVGGDRSPARGSSSLRRITHEGRAGVLAEGVLLEAEGKTEEVERARG